MTEIQQIIKAAISEGKQHAVEPQQDAAQHGEKKGPEPKPKLALVPYTIVRCLASLENIYETRLLGWTLAKAQSVLKLYNKDLSHINVEHALNVTRVTIPARLLLAEDDKNYSNVKKSFTLATKKIEYERENRLYHLNIIAFPELIKDGKKSLVVFYIHNELWHALLDFSKGYRMFSLETYMKLQSTYSVILYLLISQQSGPRNYSIEALKQLLGCDTQKAYSRGFNFFNRVIEPARAELIEKAPWYFEYSATKLGRTHKICECIITPVLNKKVALGDNAVSNTADALRLRLDDAVRHYLTEHFKMTAREQETIEPLILRLGNTAEQLAMIGSIRQRTLAGRVKNPAGYLVRSLQTLAKK